MALDFPSLRFQPEFYSGGISRFHLPLLYDLVTLRQPARIVTLGFGDGQPHFTFLQAAREQKIAKPYLTIRRDVPNEEARDDEAWQKAIVHSAEKYGDHATLVASAPAEFAAEQAAASVISFSWTIATAMNYTKGNVRGARRSAIARLALAEQRAPSPVFGEDFIGLVREMIATLRTAGAEI